ncbi:periplasmic oligopeptide-binding protein OppA [Caenispirillum salinarum AK4]|uniref:Periplasmic oligopeptide-binding protein OppA n=1 Tax=Caenispirillum salinarum AK4 TaxID=1238182 RepID=K9GW01_9PROT|nr:ABC transporter substrate-binding protein [Caenispirillum salinarum]EKV28944.1 periplasmic oligopeptide-binding protein OppA [Caenispirillum salinarum AK4]
MRLRTTLLAAAVAATAGVTLGAPAPAGAQELRVGFSADALTLDPANHRNRETETIIRNMYDGVLTRTPDMQLAPQLAEGWSQTSPTTYEFTIRDGVTFHDGSALTAQDIKYTFDRLIQDGAMNGQTSPRKSLLGPLDRVEVKGDRTVVFTLSEPWPIFPAMLPFQEVVPDGFTGAGAEGGANVTSNGTGPFKLVEWRKGDAVIMERFEDYYGGSPDNPPVGKACVERAIFQIIPESASRVAALLAGDVQIINELPAHAMGQVENNPDTEVLTVNGTRTFFVALNNAQPPFDDPRVRKAANYALDKQLIIDRILNGTATPLNGVLSPDAFGHNPDLKEYGHDLEKAKALLAEAGHEDGLDVTMDVEGPFKDTAEAIASLLSKAGIRAKVQVAESAILKDKWRSDEAPEDGQMWLTSWGNGSLDPVGIFNPTLTTGGRGNSAHYSNPEVDALLEQAATEMDQEKRAALYRQAQEIVNEDAPWIFLWLPQDIYGVSKRLTNWQPSADSRINLHDACLK